MFKKTKQLIVFIGFLIVMPGLIAQTTGSSDESPVSIGADLVSRYVWRGLNLGGSSPSIQPGIEYSLVNTDHALSIGAWGAYSFSGTQTGQEADLFISYTFKELVSLTVTDYFFPDETSSRFDYFNYNRNQTGHLYEASIGFNGTEKLPISILFAMNFYGDDAHLFEVQDGVMTETEDIVMSKYLEIGYTTELKGTSLDLFAGACLDSSDTENGAPVGFYGQEKAGLINLGMTLSRDIHLTNSFDLPVFGSFIFNPEAGNVFMVFGISL